MHRSTASLGSGSFRTGAALETSVGRRRRPPLWPLALAAVALTLMALGVVAYRRMPATPYAAVPAAQPATVVQLSPPVAAAAAPEPVESVRVESRPVGPTTVVAAARPAVVPSETIASSPPSRAPSEARPRPPQRPVAHAESDTAVLARAEPAPVRPAQPRRRAESASLSGAADEIPSPAADEDDEIVFPVRTPPRPAAVLGANQSPILD